MTVLRRDHVDNVQFSESEMAEEIRKILAGWRDMYDLERDDHARGMELWRFTEATHMGLFAAAASQAGHPAFMELATDKKKAGAAKRSSGRCDMVMRVNEQSLFVEAKRSRPVISSRTPFKDALDKVDARFKTARIDAAKTRKGRWSVGRLSLVFVVPRISCTNAEKAFERAMSFSEALLVWANDHKKASFHAASFVTDKTRLLEHPRFRNKNGTLFPGVLAIGRLHGRAVREPASKGRGEVVLGKGIG